MPREDRKYLIVAIVAILVIVGAFLLRPGPDEHADDTTGPSAVPSDAESSATPSAEPKRRKAKGGDGQPVVLGADGLPPGLPSGFGTGNGSNYMLDPHKLTITLTAQGQVGYTAWVIPTSTDDGKGTATVKGKSWSLTTTVYGKPDYAVVWAQAGWDGKPVTCTITVDGRVTEQRTTEGPFGAMWCKG